MGCKASSSTGRQTPRGRAVKGLQQLVRQLLTARHAIRQPHVPDPDSCMVARYSTFVQSPSVTQGSSSMYQMRPPSQEGCQKDECNFSRELSRPPRAFDYRHRVSELLIWKVRKMHSANPEDYSQALLTQEDSISKVYRAFGLVRIASELRVKLAIPLTMLCVGPQKS